MNEKIYFIVKGLNWSIPLISMKENLNSNEKFNEKSKKNDFTKINLKNIQISSTLEYLTDSGKIKKTFSEKEILKDVLLIPKPKTNEDGVFLDNEDIIKNESIENDIKNENIENIKINESIENDINQNIIDFKESNHILNSKTYTVSTLYFIILKILNFFGFSQGRILYTYTEFEYIPFLLQIFFHIPLIITAIIIFIVILTFDPELNKDLIKEEIDKLPETEYKLEMGFHECSVCLDNFVDGENIRILNCGHSFHKLCIDNWLINSLHCPICRSSVSKLTDTFGYEMYRAMNYV